MENLFVTSRRNAFLGPIFLPIGWNVDLMAGALASILDHEADHGMRIIEH